jgi:hypothetical protein
MTQSVTIRHPFHFPRLSIWRRLFLGRPHRRGNPRAGCRLHTIGIHILICIAALSLASRSLSAQSSGKADEGQPPGAPASDPAAVQPSSSPQPIRVAGWTLGGSLRLRFEDWDFFKAQTGDSRYGFGASLLRVSVSRQFRSHDWLFELEQPWLIGLPSQAIAPPPQGQLGFGGTYRAANPDRAAGIFLKQAFVRFKGLAGDRSSTLRIGRFEFGEGLELNPEGQLGAVVRDRVANRLIGNFGFTHVGRSLDGIHFSRGASNTNFTVVAARPTEGVFQVKGMKDLNVEIVYGAWSKVHRSLGEGGGRIFATYYRDGRDVLKTDNRPLPLRSDGHRNISVVTAGGNYVNVFGFGAGKADVLLWGAVQTGTWGTLAHRANAFAAEAGYQLGTVRFKPWLRGGYFRGTGDDDPTDGTHRTFFQELPTPRPFARFPLYNLMNNEDGFVQLTVSPHRKWTLRSEAHSLSLANAQDLWYIGGGAFQKGTFGYTGRPPGGHKGFAVVVDLSADYQFDPQTTFTFYVAHTTGKAVVRNIFPDGPNARLAYVEFNRRF